MTSCINHGDNNGLLASENRARRGEEKQVVGIAEVIRESYHDPTDEKGVFLAVDVKAVKPFPKPVTLAAIKSESRLKEMALAKYPRLSVQPVTAQEWKIVCGLGGVKD